MSTITDGLTVDELQRLLRQSDAAVLLVPPRILRRVIKLDRGLTGLGLQVPHHKSYVVPIVELLRVVDRSELGAHAENPPTDHAILLPIPDFAFLRQRSRAAILTRYWRLLFHARVHRCCRCGARKEVSVMM